MSGDGRLAPRGIKPSSTNGDVLTTASGQATWAPPVVPATPDPIVTVVDGIPGLVFDNDGEILYVEGP